MLPSAKELADPVRCSLMSPHSWGPGGLQNYVAMQLKSKDGIQEVRRLRDAVVST